MTTLPIWSATAACHIEFPILEVEAGELTLQSMLHRPNFGRRDEYWFFAHAGWNWMASSQRGDSLDGHRKKAMLPDRGVALADVDAGIRETVAAECALRAQHLLMVDGRCFQRVLGPTLKAYVGKPGVPPMSFPAFPQVGSHFSMVSIAVAAFDVAEAVEDLSTFSRAKRADGWRSESIDRMAIQDHVAARGAQSAVIQFLARHRSSAIANEENLKAIVLAREHFERLWGDDPAVFQGGEMVAGASRYIIDRQSHDDREMADLVRSMLETIDPRRGGVDRAILELAGRRLDRHLAVLDAEMSLELAGHRI